MSLYNKYVLGFEGRSYSEGRNDCFGLARDWYRKIYDLRLPNFARPGDLRVNGQNVVYMNMKALGFKIVQHVSFNQLEIGDGLIMRVNSPDGEPNHCAVYVGNEYFLHHLFNQESTADVLTERWKHRVVEIIRHPEVEAINRETPLEQVSVLDLMPPAVRARFKEQVDTAVESPTGTSGVPPEDWRPSGVPERP